MMDCKNCVVRNYGFCRIPETSRGISCPFRHELKGKQEMTEKEKQVVRDILADEDLKKQLYEMLSVIGQMEGVENHETGKTE